MILTTKTIGLLLTIALATGGAAWSVHALMAPSSGTGTDYGLDTNGNGRFDWLVVEADLSFPEAGTWDVSADLSTSTHPVAGPCGNSGVPVPMLRVSDVYGPIAWVYERYFFPAGPQTVRMAFAGTDIARAGVDGPYRVHAQLSIGGYPYPVMGRPEPISSGEFLEWNYTTKGYAASSFEEPVRPAFFTGPHADSAIYVDADGLADFLEITADVHVNVEGRFTLYGTLSRNTGSEIGRTIAYAYRDFDLKAADTRVFVRFRGDTIRQANIDAPWNFTLTLYGSMPYPYMEGTAPPVADLRPGLFVYPEMLCGSTAAYRSTDFDDTVELLHYTGHFEEATPDVDVDGKFDSLIVRAEVDVLVAAVFDLSGILRPVGSSAELVRAAGQIWLQEGLQWVDFAFPGPAIRASGVDGPYEATLSLTPAAGGIDPMTTFVTKPYHASDFDDDVTGVKGYWFGNVSAAPVDASLAISVTVVRGNDLLTVVFEDSLQVTVLDSAGSIVGSFKATVSLPSGGSEQALSFSVPGISAGSYTITVVLGSPDRPVDSRTLVVTV